jgi:biofilm PGA synthesis protein PgaA
MGTPSIAVNANKLIAVCLCGLALLVFVGITHAATTDSPAEYEADGDWAAALGGYLSALERSPQDADARKGAWRAAMRLGLFKQAASLGATLDEFERAQMEGDQIAIAIRYGRIDARMLTGPERYERLDAAIARSDSLAEEYLRGAEPDAEAKRRLMDRLSALAARNRQADVVRLYEAMHTRGNDITVYALKDVAGAYLALRRPREAEALYRKVLAESPDDFDANLGLFYALVESERLDLATAHIDSYTAGIPSRRNRDGQPNPERLSAASSSDLARIYADRPTEAQQRIRSRVDVMPFNGEVRSAEASLHLARGWTREGEADLRRNLGRDPRNPGLHADRAETLLELQQWKESRAELALAQRLGPDDATVRRATETFGLHDRRELYVDAGYGRGQPVNPNGTTDWHVDAWLYSSPLGERWRAFLHQYTAYGEVQDSNTPWNRSGAGAEWRSRDWRATFEANTGGGVKTGASASLQWQPNDYWKIYGGAAIVANEIPLRAVNAGVTAKRGILGVDWSANESRKLAATTIATDFSDGNRRRSVAATWVERWVSGPRWTLESTVGADATENSLGYRVAYFNPPHDHSIWVDGALEHLTWRNYDRSFRQGLTLSGGPYWQAGFAGGKTASIEYEHRWELNRNLWLRYSVGRSLRPYDGVQESRNFATLTVRWQF